MGYLSTFVAREDRYACLLLAGLIVGVMFNGYDAGIMTVILADKHFIEYYNVDPDRTGVIASIPWASTGLAQLFIGGTLASVCGRLWALRIAILTTCIGVTIQVVPNTYAVLIVGRLITGLGFGCTYIATSLYVAETAPTGLRGSFVGTVTQFGYQLGTLVAFWCGYGLTSSPAVNSVFNLAWRLANVIQIPIGLAFVAVSFLYPESPRWLLEQQPDNPNRALEQLSRLRSLPKDHSKVQAEMHEIVASHAARAQLSKGYWGLIKDAAMRKRLMYGLYAMSLQQIGGIAALTMYATLIYESLGWNNGTQALSINGIQAALQLVIVLVNTFTVDRFGRKPLLIAGFAIQAAALMILASLLTRWPDNTNKAAGVIEVAMLFIVGMTYCWSNGPITPAIASEIFPQHVRDKAFALSCLGQTVCLLALTQPFPKFNSEVGGESYWLLFSLNAAALVSVIFILPETKGISLERMDKLFGQVDMVDAGEQQIEKESVQPSPVTAELEKEGMVEHVDVVSSRS